MAYDTKKTVLVLSHFPPRVSFSKTYHIYKSIYIYIKGLWHKGFLVSALPETAISLVFHKKNL